MPPARTLQVDLAGATAVVTGSTRGIGRAISRRLLDAGAQVIGLQRGTGSLGAGHTTLSVDLADADARQAAVDRVLADHRVDILVNNAGINLRHRFEDFPLAEFSQVMAVNLDAVVHLTQALGTPMLERGEGRIITIASMLRSEEHTSELQSRGQLVCRLLLEKQNVKKPSRANATSAHGC